jgi:hypothetical protein
MINEKKRLENECKFIQWDIMVEGGRRYWYDIQGRYGWVARYVKEVDKNEKTIRFYQEIFDNHGRLVEVHQKYPVDTGHQLMGKEIT